MIYVWGWCGMEAERGTGSCQHVRAVDRLDDGTQSELRGVAAIGCQDNGFAVFTHERTDLCDSASTSG